MVWVFRVFLFVICLSCLFLFTSTSGRLLFLPDGTFFPAVLNVPVDIVLKFLFSPPDQGDREHPGHIRPPTGHSR